MKHLILIRHAKSSWDFDVEDFDRPLNSRGKSDAEEMAKRLLKKDIKIDAFISSPAKRAISTAGYFAEAYEKKPKYIIEIEALYEPTFEAILNSIENFDDDFKTVALFSHNPTLTNFANQLTDFKIDDMPTCAIFAVKIDIKNWKDFNAAKKEYWFFDYPKSD